MECLPAGLESARFYEPGAQGWEAKIRERLQEIQRLRRRGSGS
jgi:replication-associated recombination protein RarA